MAERIGVFKSKWDDWALNRRADWFAYQQSRELIGRNPSKYIRQQVVLMATGVIYPTLLRGYQAGRAIDDMADDDAPVPEEFEDFPGYADYLRSRLGNLNDPSTPTGKAEVLFIATMRTVVKKENKEGEAIQGANLFLDAMTEEHDRRVKRRVLTRQKLYDLNQRSFGTSADMAFMSLGLEERSGDMPELAESQAVAYSQRDFATDLSSGICNVPSEILNEAGISFPELTQEVIEDPDFVTKDKILGNWRAEERKRALVLVDDLRERDMGRKARIMTNFLASKVVKICNSNFERT